MARLRFGSNNLNASKSRWFSNTSEQCECGATETVEHFLLYCPRFSGPRSTMKAKVRTFWDDAITEDFLLGGGGVRLSKEHWQLVVSAVADFVGDTKRSIWGISFMLTCVLTALVCVSVFPYRAILVMTGNGVSWLSRAECRGWTFCLFFNRQCMYYFWLRIWREYVFLPCKENGVCSFSCSKLRAWHKAFHLRHSVYASRCVQPHPLILVWWERVVTESNRIQRIDLFLNRQCVWNADHELL